MPHFFWMSHRAASKTAMFCKLRFLPSRFVQGRITNSYLPQIKLSSFWVSYRSVPKMPTYKLCFLPSECRTKASQKISVCCKLRFLPSWCRTQAHQNLSIYKLCFLPSGCRTGAHQKFPTRAMKLSSFWMSYKSASKIPMLCKLAFLPFGCRTGSEARFGFRSAHLSGFFVKGEPWGTRSRKRSSSQVEMKNLSILVFGSRSFFGVTHATYEGHIGLGIYSKSSLPAVHYWVYKHSWMKIACMKLRPTLYKIAGRVRQARRCGGKNNQKPSRHNAFKSFY